MRRQPPPSYLPALLEFMADGMPLYRAAQEMGKSPSACHAAVARYAPDYPRRRKPRVTADERREFLERFNAGESIDSMSRDTGREWRTIERHLILTMSDRAALSAVRCDGCGALIETPFCVRCSLVDDRDR